MSAEYVAWLFGVTDRTIRNWADLNGMPRMAHGMYCLASVVQWKMRQVASPADKQEASAPTDTARRELYIAQRQRIELEIERRRAQLLPAALVEQMLRTVEEVASRHIDGLAERCVGPLTTMDDPPAIQGLLFTEGRATRRAIAADIQSMAEALEADQ